MKKNAFTLIELLAVIVILAVILVISIPRILDVIDVSKKDSFKTSTQLIADSAEKKYVENKLNNIDEEITCENVSKLSKEDYEYCFVKIDNEGNAKVTIKGKGKFKDLAICNGTKTSVELSDTCSTDAKYFAYEEVEGLVLSHLLFLNLLVNPLTEPLHNYIFYYVMVVYYILSYLYLFQLVLHLLL